MEILGGGNVSPPRKPSRGVVRVIYRVMTCDKWLDWLYSIGGVAEEKKKKKKGR